MALNVCLPLFGNAGHELEEGAPLHGKQLRTLGEELQQRLLRIADILDRLEADGWSATTAMYDAFLTHNKVQTRAEAETRLTALGIDVSELMILEEEDEEEL